MYLESYIMVWKTDFSAFLASFKFDFLAYITLVNRSQAYRRWLQNPSLWPESDMVMPGDSDKSVLGVAGCTGSHFV